LRALVRAILESDRAITVVGEAATGLEAVSGVVAHRPDVLILDLAMPGMDGFEVMVQLREQAPETKVVVLSSFPGEHMADVALRLGAARYVEKSLDVKGLREVVLAV
jgi:DNA-binding NarL/FixJ family response regulator